MDEERLVDPIDVAQLLGLDLRRLLKFVGELDLSEEQKAQVLEALLIWYIENKVSWG